MSLGQVDRSPPRVEQRAAGLDLVGLEQRAPIVVALGGEEREAHAAADDQRVGDLEQGLDHAELVAHLGAAEDGHERARCGSVRSGSSTSTSRGEQPTGRRRQELRRTDDRGVGPVRRAEGVVDVERPGPRSARCTNAGSLAVSPGSKRRFSSSSTPGRQLGQPGPHRLHRVLRVGRALGPTEVACTP